MTYLRVIAPFTVWTDRGTPRSYRAGDTVRADDKVIKGRAKYFAEIEESHARVSAPLRVEQATAAPGELRSLPEGTTVKKAAAKKAQKKT